MFHFPFHIWDVILPIDELIFFKMVKTTNQFFLISLDGFFELSKYDIYGLVMISYETQFGNDNSGTYVIYDIHGLVMISYDMCNSVW